MSIEILFDLLLDACMDSLRLVPFLLVTYVIMEYLEHKTSTKTWAVVRKAGRLGPLTGSLAGAFPQCGFSAAASNLYAGGVITVGTLLAVFLSTSDEMLPIFISEAVDVRVIVMIVGSKAVLGMLTGFLVDFLFRFRPSLIRYKEIHVICESEHCGCEKNIFTSAVRHTVKIFAVIFFFSAALNVLIEFWGEDRLAQFMSDQPVLGPVLAGIVGLLPNCAASVMVTKLYLGQFISLGAMMSGLLVGAGVGLLVLFQVNKKWKENLLILVVLYSSGVAWGIVIDLFFR